jgi:hypothetical protein
MGTRIFGDAPFGLGDDPARVAGNGRPTPAGPTPAQGGDAYRGGAVTVNVNAGDTQESVARKAAYEHARGAGLSEAESSAFAEWWLSVNRPADGKTYLYHLDGGNLRGYTDEEFAAVKREGVWRDELNPAVHRRAIDDINGRLRNERDPAPDFEVDDADVIRIDADPNDVAASQGGIDSATRRRAEVESKPLQANVDGGARKDGKPFDADTALGRYVQQTYNRDGRVWGDKINEVVSLAKLRGVRVENLRVGEDGRATFGLSAEDRQKLDGLFAEALGETIKGEEAAERAREETQNMLLDFYKIQANGAINVVNDATKLVGAPAIPKFDIESEYWNKGGRKEAGELATTVTAALLTGKLGAVGKVINVGDTAASTTEAVVGADLRTGEELSTTQRVIQGVSGALTTRQAARDATELADDLRRRVTGARLRFPDLTAPQLATPEGFTFGAGEVADDLPARGADDLVMEARGRTNGRYAGQSFPIEEKALERAASARTAEEAEKWRRVAESYPGGVRFTADGFPDFSPYAEKTVKIHMQGNYTSDFDAANAAAGYTSTPRGYTWHHNQDRMTMQLVPQDLHDLVRHDGGISEIKKKGILEW